MKTYGKKSNFKKKVLKKSQKNSEKISRLNLKLVNQIIDTSNISLIILIFILFFLSFDSQRKWSYLYKTLSQTRVINNNLIDYISKTEEFYISQLESLNIYRKTKPKDLMYLDRVEEKKESFFDKNLRIFMQGISDSKYLRGY